jgi:uncharacterized protein (TIGR02466 family)
MVRLLFLFIVIILIDVNFADDDLMRFMWVTPISMQNLLAKTGDVARDSSLDAFQVSKVKAEVLDDYESYKIHSTLRDKDATNLDLFYLHQQQDDRASRPESFYNLLAKTFHKAIQKYITELHAENHMVQLYMNLSDEEIRQKIFIWASIHLNGTGHQPHHHVNSAVSGVFYVSVPPGSGDIVFNDPRGGLPPFGKTLRIKPTIGDVILFPGYLIHSVLPTLTSEPRISISFNLEGNWDLASDVNEGFYV